MRPTHERIKELQDRFDVYNGRFFAEYRFKNLNWYLGTEPVDENDPGEWFCYGDIREEDLQRIYNLLESGEVLTLGWKELGQDQRHDNFFGDGHGVWLVMTFDGVQYDVRRDRQPERSK